MNFLKNKRKRDFTTFNGSSNNNKIENDNYSNRDSLILMRELCNLYKRKAYDLANVKNKSVLDLGSGKLGDFWKLINARAKIVVGVDMNEEYTREGRNRIYQSRQSQLKKLNESHANTIKTSIYNNNNKKSKTEVYETINNQHLPHPDNWPEFHLFAPIDMGNSRDIEQVVKTIPFFAKQDTIRFDLVTAFFSIHTMFENANTLSNLCETVDRFLRPEIGAKFIATFMDGTYIVKWMNKYRTKTLYSPGNFEIKLTTIKQNNNSDNKNENEDVETNIPSQVKLGIPIQVEMSAQTVSNHIEYLTDLELLEKEFLSRKIKLVFSEMFSLQEHDEKFRQMSDSERCWLECNRLVCFERFE